MNTTEARHLVNEVSDVIHSLPEEDRAISEHRYIAEHTGMELFESVLASSKRWTINGTNLLMDHPAGVTLDIDVVGSMLVAVQLDEHHLVISVDGKPICVAGEGLYHDVPMSDHLTTVVLLGEAGFPVSHTPDTLYMLHSPTDLLAIAGNEYFSLQERLAASKMLAAYVHEEEGEGSISTRAFALAAKGNLPPQVELELVNSELYPMFVPSHEEGGGAMVDAFLNLILRLTRHRPDEYSNELHRFIDLHVRTMSRADQERVRDKLLMLSETFRPDLEPLFETADGVYLTTWDFDHYHDLHEEIIHLPPHLRIEHLGVPADAYENVHDVEDIMDF